MAAKKPAKKSSKALGKKTMKKTKGGILIGLNQPTTFVKIESPTLNTGTQTNLGSFWKF